MNHQGNVMELSRNFTLSGEWSPWSHARWYIHLPGSLDCEKNIGTLLCRSVATPLT